MCLCGVDSGAWEVAAAPVRPAFLLGVPKGNLEWLSFGEARIDGDLCATTRLRFLRLDPLRALEVEVDPFRGCFGFGGRGALVVPCLTGDDT